MTTEWEQDTAAQEQDWWAHRQMLIDEASGLLILIDEARQAIVEDCAGTNPSPAVIAYHGRLCDVYTRATRRLIRRGGDDPNDDISWTEYQEEAQS
jgi:hypothetical protein